MGLNLRKFAVGFLALSVLAGVFLLYMRLNRTPPIIVEPAKSAPTPVVEGNGRRHGGAGRNDLWRRYRAGPGDEIPAQK